MRRIRFHPSASEETNEAVAWYSAVRPELGRDFIRELEAALALLRTDPVPSTPHPHVAKRLGARRLTLKRFTFDLVFIERDADLHIVAIAHHSRRPGYWKARLRI